MFICAQTAEHRAVFPANKMSIQEKKEGVAYSTVFKILICHQLCMTSAGKGKSLQEEKSVLALERREQGGGRGRQPTMLESSSNFSQHSCIFGWKFWSVCISVEKAGRKGGSLFFFPNNISAQSRTHPPTSNNQRQTTSGSTILKLDWMTTIPPPPPLFF